MKPAHSSAYICLPLALSVALACDQPNVHDTTGIRAQSCASCHMAAYNTVANPPHVDTLPQTCGDCHSTTSWTPATVLSHPWFTLDGSHLTAPCSGCHAGSPSTFVGVPSACAGCHLADYEASPYPQHSTFPKTCLNCHNTTSWSSATAGTHPEASFPITKGPHSIGVTCSDCHIASLGSPTKGANCDCVHCHLGAHNAPAIDSVHTALGAAYTPSATGAPNACLTCHPAG